MGTVAQGLNSQPACALTHAPWFFYFATRSLTGVCLSFNGGKDCTVILHLLFAVIDHCRSTGALPATMTPFDVKAIYFETKDQFPEVVQFMHAMQQRYVSAPYQQ